MASLPTGILDYGTTGQNQAALAALNGELMTISATNSAVTSALTPMGMDGASLVAQVQQTASNAAWNAMQQVGSGLLAVDHVGTGAHVAEVAANDVAGQVAFAAIETAGIVI